jgi:hypothetical protein
MFEGTEHFLSNLSKLRTLLIPVQNFNGDHRIFDSENQPLVGNYRNKVQIFYFTGHYITHNNFKYLSSSAHKAEILSLIHHLIYLSFKETRT